LQVSLIYSKNDADASPARRFAAQVDSNQPRTPPSLPKQNIVMNLGIRFTDLADCKLQIGLQVTSLSKIRSKLRICVRLHTPKSTIVGKCTTSSIAEGWQ